jgi:hypothetical protein
MEVTKLSKPLTQPFCFSNVILSSTSRQLLGFRNVHEGGVSEHREVNL